jgi:hypothetical protein
MVITASETHCSQELRATVNILPVQPHHVIIIRLLGAIVGNISASTEGSASASIVITNSITISFQLKVRDGTSSAIYVMPIQVHRTFVIIRFITPICVVI